MKDGWMAGPSSGPSPRDGGPSQTLLLHSYTRGPTDPSLNVCPDANITLPERQRNHRQMGSLVDVCLQDDALNHRHKTYNGAFNCVGVSFSNDNRRIQNPKDLNNSHSQNKLSSDLVPSYAFGSSNSFPKCGDRPQVCKSKSNRVSPRSQTVDICNNFNKINKNFLGYDSEHGILSGQVNFSENETDNGSTSCFLLQSNLNGNGQDLAFATASSAVVHSSKSEITGMSEDHDILVAKTSNGRDSFSEKYMKSHEAPKSNNRQDIGLPCVGNQNENEKCVSDGSEYSDIPLPTSALSRGGLSARSEGLCRSHWWLVPLMLLSVSTLITSPVAADQVVLLDTTLESSLKWTRYPFGPNSPTPGWIEESFTRFEEGINWRSYVVCDVNYPSVNNWLWTPFIERGPANMMYVEIKFSMRDCSLFPGTALSCKETFSLLYYEFDAATKEPPFWESESYKLIDRIAADDGRFTNNNEVIINTEVRSIPVTKKGVYFALRDQGACISLLSIKVYYMTCPEITVSFAHFPTTPTGAKVTSIEQATGTCIEHARVEREPVYLCTADGQWSLLTGGCVCMPGYQANVETQTCDVCPPGQFKHGVGELECSGCPEHSAAPHSGSTECRCDTGYYRANHDPKDMPCTRPPGKPRNLTATVLDQSTVELSWLPPLLHGGRSDTVYRVVCDACGSQVAFVPPQVAEEGFNTTDVKVRGLNPVTAYRFQVIAENGVSDQAPHHSNVAVTVTTEAAGSFRALPSDNKGPSMVRNVRITSVKSTEISLAWQPPLDAASEVEMYEVQYYVKGHENNSSTILTTKEESSLAGLRHRTVYGFRVREKTVAGWGEYSAPVYKETGQLFNTAYVGDEDNTQVRIIVGSIVGVFVVIVVIVVIVIVIMRRNTDECNKKQPSDCDTLEYRNGEVHGVLENPPIVQTHTAGSMTAPLFTPAGHHRTYIDPHTYEDPNQAIREFAREIDASYITIEAIIGGGEFGDVCKGKLTLPGRPEMTVAIKTLKPGSSDKARVDFLTEASIMGQFEHPNVIFLQGVVTRSNPVMIITEYMENGSLDHFLRVNDGKFQVLQLVGMLRCIASGMQYLSEMNYVHRDLAARNVLVNAQLVCKIADFGLSREIESHTEAAYTTRGGKIPVRWTAPEAIAFRKFTSASDVWSLGIVMWEVMSYGERPYWNWSNQDVIKSIEKGYRLPAPMECPEAIYQLMLDCWQKERNHRPSFASIVHTLDNLIRTPEALAKVAQNRCQTALGLDSTDLTQLGSVEEWLSSLKMSRYLENFESAGLSDVQSVARLNQRDLTTLGITLVGHQKKILQSIQTLRTQLAVSMAEGFLV